MVFATFLNRGIPNKRISNVEVKHSTFRGSLLDIRYSSLSNDFCMLLFGRDVIKIRKFVR